VRGHDQIGVGRDLRGRDASGIRLYDNLDAGGLGGGRQPVFAVVHDDTHDIGPMLRNVFRVVTPKWREPTRVIRICSVRR